MKNRRVLVTGGAGFIGSHLVDKLIEDENEVFVIDNLRSGKTENIEHHYNTSKFLFENRDIQDDEMYDVFRIFRPEVVFHLAAIPGVPFSVVEPVESNMVNVQGTVNLLHLSKKFDVERFVFSSSSAIYGGSEVLPTNEEVESNPQSPYALQKLIGEQYCQHFSKVYDLDTVCLRYFNVFGPRQFGDSPYAAVISAFLDAKKLGKQAKIFGDGEQFRDFCFVDNVVQANLLAAGHSDRFDGEVFNVGCEGSVTINQLKEQLEMNDVEYLPERDGDVRCSTADISKISERLGYNPTVNFEDGLKITRDWYMEL